MSQTQAYALREIRRIRGTPPASTQAVKLCTAFLVVSAGSTGIVKLGARLLVTLIA